MADNVRTIGPMAGIRQAFRLASAASRGTLPAPPPTQVGSPWADTSHLDPIVWADLGLPLPLTRAEAMRVPAVARARHNLCPTIARFPLQVYARDVLVDPQPSWCQRTDTPVSPYHRMLWTVDDVLFYGWSLWAIERGADGFPLAAARVPQELWSFDQDGRVVDEDFQPVPDDQAVLIPGPNEGVLAFGADAIRHAAALARASQTTAETPAANTELHQTVGALLDREDVDDLIGQWAAARRGDNGGVAYTPPNVEVRDHGTIDAHLLVEGRNAAAVDVARVMGQPASMIDATTASAGLEYNTGETRNAQFLDYGLAAYVASIAARLSMDDVVPRGQRTAFDLQDFLSPVPGTSGPVTDD